MNLNCIPHLSKMFQVPVGLSDHTMGATIPVAAVALGACIIEKHFTLSRTIPGPDAPFSLEPHEFRQLTEAVRAAEKALGTVCYGPTEEEKKSLVFRRSLFVVQDIRAGAIFTSDNIRSIRPGYGLAPKVLRDIRGRHAARDLASGTPLAWEHIAPE
jgi:N-acetylneuraminate synthase